MKLFYLAKILNEGISKPIYVLDKISEVEKLIPNIHPMPIDFYTIGLILSRISIKKIMGTVKDDDTSLTIEVN